MSEEQIDPQETPQQVQQHPFQPQNGGFNGGFNNLQRPLPNGTAVLVLGILSIVTCCCWGIIGVILGVIALILANKDSRAYHINPALYTEGSYKNLNAGKICAIIGLVLSLLTVIYYVVLIAKLGFGALSDPDKLREAIEQLK